MRSVAKAVLVAAMLAVGAGQAQAGKGSIVGTAIMKTKGVFGLFWVEEKTCSGRPVWATPVEPWSTKVMDGLYHNGPRFSHLEERYKQGRIEVICRHDGSFRFDGLEVGRSYYVEALVRWKTRNMGRVQGGWRLKYVDVSSSVPVEVAL